MRITDIPEARTRRALARHHGLEQRRRRHGKR